MARPEGSLNKTTKATRETLQDALKGHIEAISSTLDQVQDPAERIRLITALLPFIAPKHKAIEIRDTAETFTISFKDPDSL